VRLARTTDPSTGGPAYLYDDIVRDLPLGLLAAGFAVVVVLVARWRGLAALVGLGVAYAVLVFFLLPALLAGEPALPVGLTAAAAILFVVLYVAHGLSASTSAALLGTLVSLGLTGGLAAAVTGAARITGLSSDAITAVQTDGRGAQRGAAGDEQVPGVRPGGDDAAAGAGEGGQRGQVEPTGAGMPAGGVPARASPSRRRPRRSARPRCARR
jgi:hypothetical protein